MRNKLFQTLSSLAALNLAGGLLLAEASSASALSSANAPAVAWSAGALRINGADHTGSGNVLPGGKIQMLRSSGQLYLADGTRMRLSADTRLTVEPQNVSLDSGIARVDSVPAPDRPLHISAGELRVTASGGTLTRSRPDQLIVTAANTSTEVRRGNTLLAMVHPGQTLSFTVLANQAQSGASAAPSPTNVETAEDEAEKKRCKDVKTEKEAKRRKCGAYWAGAAGAAGAGAGAAAGAAAAGGVAAAAGVSTAVVAGVVVATVAAVATSVALVASEDAKTVSTGPIL